MARTPCKQAQENSVYRNVSFQNFSVHNGHYQWRGRFKSVRICLLCMNVEVVARNENRHILQRRSLNQWLCANSL
jgi:hypothetical protein